MNDTKITGGDLYDLWRVANINMPHVQAVYADACNVIHEVNVANEEKFGRAHPGWAALGQIYEQCLFLTEGSLFSVAHYIDKAVKEFKEVDAEAARDLEAMFKDPNEHDPDDELTGDEKPKDVEVPNWWND